MASRGGLVAVSKQVRDLRDEEASDESFFALPDAGDPEVNWYHFDVDIQGPVRAP